MKKVRFLKTVTGKLFTRPHLSVFALALFTLLAASAFCDDYQRTSDFSKQQPSWSAVISGSVVAQPVKTSYGYILLNDGRMLSAVSDSGKVLWQKGVKGNPSKYLTVSEDFICAVTKSSILNYVNPSGLTLWTADTGFEITANPYCGKDGRIIVKGKKKIACYGINGRRKWLIETEPLNNLPLTVLNDGTLLAFLEKQTDRKSRAHRFTAFGELIETITFTGNVTAVLSEEDGVFLSMEGGGAGFIKMEDFTLQSKWISRLSPNTASHILNLSDGSVLFLSQSGSSCDAVIASRKNGTIISQFSLGNLNLSKLAFLTPTENGAVLSDEKRALEFSRNGKIIWSAAMPKKKWTQAFYSDKNAVVVCMDNWTVNAYIMNQTTTKKAAQPSKKTESYLSSPHPTGTLSALAVSRLSNDELSSIEKSLLRGDYGKDEQDMIESIQNELANWEFDESLGGSSNRFGRSYFVENPVYAQSILNLAVESQVRTFSLSIANLLSLEKDPVTLQALIKTAGAAAYDNNGKMLSAFESLVMRRTTAKDPVTCRLICDATYEICRYMGKPALMTKGKTILTNLFYPQYDKSTREYARQTLTKIADLEI